MFLLVAANILTDAAFWTWPEHARPFWFGPVLAGIGFGQVGVVAAWAAVPLASRWTRAMGAALALPGCWLFLSALKGTIRSYVAILLLGQVAIIILAVAGARLRGYRIGLCGADRSGRWCGGRPQYSLRAALGVITLVALALALLRTSDVPKGSHIVPIAFGATGSALIVLAVMSAMLSGRPTASRTGLALGVCVLPFVFSAATSGIKNELFGWYATFSVTAVTSCLAFGVARVCGWRIYSPGV